MKVKIVKKEFFTLPRKSMLGHLECGHKQAVKENQKFATCKQCQRKATHNQASVSDRPTGGQADQLTKKHTAFETFQTLIDAQGGYFPTLRTRTAEHEQDRAELETLADLYDRAQEERGDQRRAFRS